MKGSLEAAATIFQRQDSMSPNQQHAVISASDAMAAHRAASRGRVRDRSRWVPVPPLYKDGDDSKGLGPGYLS